MIEGLPGNKIVADAQIAGADLEGLLGSASPH